MKVTLNEFLQNVQAHEMTIIRDDGLYRHVRFSRPSTINQRFDLITWPGHLCYTGDMGTYVFARVPDMFGFFRTPKDKINKISRSYWAEKCLSADKSGIFEFSEAEFKKEVKRWVSGWIKENRDQTTKEERRELWEEIEDFVFSYDGEYMIHRAHNFKHQLNSEVVFDFGPSFFESSFEVFTYYFDWCCYALAWGIQQYDEHKEQQACESKQLQTA